MFIMIYGNPCDGFRHVGPFKSHEDAVQYMACEKSSENCWIAELDTPCSDEEA